METRAPGLQKLLRVFVPRGACAVCRDAPHLALLCAGAAQCPRGTRGGVAPFPPSLTLFAPILFPRAQSVFLPRRRAWWESRLAGGPRTAQARGRPVNVVGQGAERLPVRQKNPAGAPKAREAEHGRGMGGSARGGRGRRGGRPPLSRGIDTLTAHRPFSLPCLWPSAVRAAAQAPRGTAGRGAGRATEERRVCH